MPVDSRAAVERSEARPLFIAMGRRSLFGWHHAPPPQCVARPGSCCVRHSATSTCRPTGHGEFLLSGSPRSASICCASTTREPAIPPAMPRTRTAGRLAPNIACAMAEARRLVGSGPVALVGLRAGALLALQAAAVDGGVERLVLWSPFRSGRAYVRELKALARLSAQDDRHDDPHEAEINAEGHIVSGDTVEALATLDAGCRYHATRVRGPRRRSGRPSG